MFCSRCGRRQQEALRGGVRGLFAFVRGLPFVPFLAQILLVTAQVRDDGAQFVHQISVAGSVASRSIWPVWGVAPGTASAGKTLNSSAGSITHCLVRSSRVAEMTGADRAQDGGLGAAGRLRCGAEGECRHGLRPVRLRVRPWSDGTVNDPSTGFAVVVRCVAFVFDRLDVAPRLNLPAPPLRRVRFDGQARCAVFDRRFVCSSIVPLRLSAVERDTISRAGNP